MDEKLKRKLSDDLKDAEKLIMGCFEESPTQEVGDKIRVARRAVVELRGWVEKMECSPDSEQMGRD